MSLDVMLVMLYEEVNNSRKKSKETLKITLIRGMQYWDIDLSTVSGSVSLRVTGS